MEEKICRPVTLTSFQDNRGALAAVEGNDTLPFEIRRVFFLYDLAPHAVRGSHAVRNEQFLLCVHGACRVRTHDGKAETVFSLKAPTEGLYVPAMTWREIFDPTADCVLAVFSDQHYDPDAYVRDFDTFLRLKAENAGAADAPAGKD